MQLIPLLIFTLLAPPLPAKTTLKDKSLNTLKERLVEINSELEQLAPLQLRGGAGAVGYQSAPQEFSNSKLWLQIELGGDFQIDEIVIVPFLWRSKESVFSANGFPLEFRIIAGSGHEKEGQQIASYTEADDLLPRLAPLVIPCPPTTASWIRIEVDRLTAQGISSKFILNFSELMIFSGSQNIALGRPLTSSSNLADLRPAWNLHFLTDGSVPYLMDGSRGEPSGAFTIFTHTSNQTALAIDLEEPLSISQINLHAMELSDTVPQTYTADYGMPKHLQIEAAIQPDFSDAVLLVDYRPSSIYEIHPILTWNVPPTQCRFIRLKILEPYLLNNGVKKEPYMALAEIEILSAGKNVALGIPMTINPDPIYSNQLKKLTDGRNYYGEILPIRQWMQELARRHDLEKERTMVMAELSHRYDRQKINLNRLNLLAVTLIAGIFLIIILYRLIHLRQVARIKERFAADLHDELGANVHSISMLSDLAKDTDSQEERKELHHRILGLSKRTTTAIRYCTDMLESKGLFIGLIQDMERTAKRIGGNFEHHFSVEGEQWVKTFPPRARIDLFLFYKEALINICRHSSASQVSTHLTADKQTICLIISDNGVGIPQSEHSQPPPALKRRAHLMGAQVKVETPSNEGTRITLQLKHPKHRILNWLRRIKQA